LLLPRQFGTRGASPAGPSSVGGIVDISIISGWLPPLVWGLAAAAVVLSVPWRRSGPGRLIVTVAAAVVLAVLAAVIVDAATPASFDLPVSAIVWAAAFAVALVAGITGWRDASGRTRVATVLALVLTAAASLGAVNTKYQEYPTIGRLVHLDAQQVVDLPALQQIRARVSATGHLPTAGVTVQVQIPAPVSGFEAKPAVVYVPPAWFVTPAPQLAAIILLPGEPGSPTDWTENGDADTIASTFAAAHGGVAPIIVMPDPNGFKTADTECVNSQFGNAETYLVTDVPAYLRRDFNVRTGAGSLAIAGLSAGGSCSVILALRNPGVFQTFATYSGYAEPIYLDDDRQQTIDDLFGGSRAAYLDHNPLTLLSRHRYPATAGWFEVGRDDTQPLAELRRLQPAAQAAGIATCELIRPGGHDFGLWSQALTDSLPWLSWRLGLTPEPPTEPATCRPGTA
jgi:S-formylglutathione hydrolase FrmB